MTAQRTCAAALAHLGNASLHIAAYPFPTPFGLFSAMAMAIASLKISISSASQQLDRCYICETREHGIHRGSVTLSSRASRSLGLKLEQLSTFYSSSKTRKPLSCTAQIGHDMTPQVSAVQYSSGEWSRLASSSVLYRGTRCLFSRTILRREAMKSYGVRQKLALGRCVNLLFVNWQSSLGRMAGVQQGSTLETCKLWEAGTVPVVLLVGKLPALKTCSKDPHWRAADVVRGFGNLPQHCVLRKIPLQKPRMASAASRPAAAAMRFLSKHNSVHQRCRHLSSSSSSLTEVAKIEGFPTMGSSSEDPDVDPKEQTRRRTITPLPVPRASDLPQFGGDHRERLYWGTYRPFCYLGVRCRSPQSLIAGLMWASTNKKDGKRTLRHYCEDQDDLTRWSWLRHDGSSYGRQVLVDQGLVVTTYFLKSAQQGSGYGGDWVIRVKVEKENNDICENSQIQSIFFYVAEEAGTLVNLWPDHNTTSTDSQDGKSKDGLFASGCSDVIGDWQLHANCKQEGVTTNYVGLEHLSMANLTNLVRENLDLQDIATGKWMLPDTSLVKAPNIGVIQLTGELPFEADLVFISGVRNESQPGVQSRAENLAGLALDKRVAQKELEFEGRFRNTFQLHEKVDGEMELETARVALSNMLGGIGYFYGQTRVAIPTELHTSSSAGGDYWDYWPASLYTAVPSRSIFPRGFLWDEGFHQLLVSRWDQSISREIIANWLDLVNVNGWIPREVILGEEAFSKIPPIYINQYTDNANPPALLLVLKVLAEDFESGRNKGHATREDAEFFKTIFPRLEVWYNWYLTSQTGKEPDSYYWHGRDAQTDVELNPKTLTSGLDDYPRASHPTDDERHVDLRCWIAYAAKSMSVLARAIDAPTEKYDKTFRELSNLTRLNELHYDEETGRYLDYGLHSEKVELRWKGIEDPGTGLSQSVLRRVVLEPPKLGWIPQFGLNSLFPFIMRLLPRDSPILGDHLKMLGAPELLWTDFGLRSLATTSSIYMKYNSEFEAPYWRGPVWININYLVLSALHDYAQGTGPYSEQAASLYRTFRQNLVNNIVRRYDETGYIWENYDNAAQGKGQGAHPFTGWSALIVLVMGEIYV